MLDPKKKKVLIYIGSLGIGGAENMAYELAKSIKGYDVEFLVHNKKRNTALEDKAEQHFKVTYLGINGHITPKSFRMIMNTLTRIQPDVIHSHLGTLHISYIWCRRHKKKCVVTAHSRPDAAFNKSNLFFLKKGLKNNTLSLVTVSKENQKLFNAYLKKDCSLYVNNGVETERYYRKEHDVFTFINVARHDDNKNQQLIIKCFAGLIGENRQAKLLLLGDGPTHNDLIELTERLGIADYVTFTGIVENTQDYYAISDCFLLASHSEALPMSCLEALSAGLPVIAAKVGGLPDIVTDKTGILVDDGDEEGYFCAMKTIMTCKTQYSEECKKMAENYSSEKMGAAYERIYAE